MRRPPLKLAPILGWTALLLAGGCADAPSPSAARSDRVQTPPLPAAQELEIRSALFDALHAEGVRGEQGMERLLQIGAPAVPILLEALSTEELVTDRNAARAMLAERLRRRRLAFILGKIRDPRAIPPLLERYDGKPFGDALEEITGQPLGDDLDAWREWYVDQPPASPEEIREAVRKFQGQGPAQRIQAMQGLADAVRPRTGAASLEPIDQAGGGLHRQVELLSVQDLEKRRAARALLLAALQDPDPGVARFARLLAVQMGSMAVQPLRAMVSGGPRDVRLSAILALGEIGDPRAVRELSTALGDPDPAVRSLSAQALGWIGSPDGSNLLARQLGRESSPEVRPALLAALVMVGQADRFEDLMALLQRGGKDRQTAVPHLQALCRRAYTLGCQQVSHLRLPVSEEAWNGYWQKLDLGEDPARWRRWWSGAREVFPKGDAHDRSGR